jgi:uncharacterized tellurite resistance protein B-like protein
MIETLLTKLRSLLESIAPGPETLAKRNARDLQEACCSLLMEVARLDASNSDEKNRMAEQAMRDQFDIPDEALTALIETTTRPENRLTSYFKPVAIINRYFGIERKARFIEQLWRVAMVDGKIDMYEDHLVRKLSDLLYVPHADFILAKNRVQASIEFQT